MHQLYVLHEDATGYALFRTNEFEEIAILLPQVQKSILDVSKFRSIVYLVAFYGFRNIDESLENMKCISNGKLHMDLQLFLENNVPKSKKSKQSIVLGVQDPDLARSINETLGITCSSSEAISEILRGVRFHFHKLVKGYKDLNTIIKTEISLGHYYSRAKLNININKMDTMIPHTINMLDQLNKDINTMTLRVREWYSFHFPELIKIVPDTESYIKCIKEIKDHMNMPSDIEAKLESVLQDAKKVEKILEASSTSMGMAIAAEDMENIERFIDQILSLMKRRNEMTEYLKLKMNKIAPNVSTLMGELDGARLISQAGGLNKLSQFPASTVQILGAEKSLFRTLKTKSKENLKFGILNQSTIIGKAGRTTKGRISRFLANKCSLASRIDCFSVIPTSIHGENLKQQVIDRRKFYETGKFAAETNHDLNEEELQILLAKKALLRKKKKERRRKKLQFSKANTEVNYKSDALNDLPEVSRGSLSDDFIMDEKQVKGKKRKSVMISKIEEKEKLHNIKENGTPEQPSLRKKKKMKKR